MLDLLVFKSTDVPATNEVVNADFSDGTSSWVSAGISKSFVVGNILHLKPNSTSDTPNTRQQIMQVDSGDKLYLSAHLLSDAQAALIRVSYRDINAGINLIAESVEAPQINEFTRLSGIVSLDAESNSGGIQFVFFYDSAPGTEAELQIKHPIVINLTKVFGKGNEPSHDQMEFLMSQFEDKWFLNTKNLFNARQFMAMYFKKVKELENAIISLGGGS